MSSRRWANMRQKTDAPVEKEKWGIGVLFLSVAALCYILGQLGFISRVPEYAKGPGHEPERRGHAGE